MARSSFCKPIPPNTVIGLSRPVAQDTSQNLYAASFVPQPTPIPFSQPFIISTHSGPPVSGDGVMVGYGYIDTGALGYVSTSSGVYAEVAL